LIITYFLRRSIYSLLSIGPPSGSLRYTALRRPPYNPRVPPCQRASKAPLR
jgi:hypothetical protein